MTILALAVLALLPTVPQESGGALPEVLIVGTFHMANPGRDLVNPDAGDVLAEERQAEIAELVTLLARFEPTHVAVERMPAMGETLNRSYRSFLEGMLEPTPDEIVQVAFPLAAENHLERIDAIDASRDLAMTEVIEYAAAHQPDIARRFDEQLAALRTEMEGLMKQPTPEIFRVMNTPNPEKDHGFYMLAAQVGSSEHPLGAEMTAAWHARNLEIFGNIARLCRKPGERILVLIGAGHAPLLRDFVERSPNLRLADTLHYLE